MSILKKVELLKKLAKSKKLDAVFLHFENPCHFWLLEKKVEDSFIIIKNNGKPIIFKSVLEGFSSKNFLVVDLKSKDVLKNKLSSLKIKNLGVDYKTFTLHQRNFFSKTKIKDVGLELKNLRKIKTDYEKNCLSKANLLTARCFNSLMVEWKKKKFFLESQAVVFIKKFAIENDCGLAFDPIVASGKNAAVPHHAENTKLNKGFCIIDLGLDFKGYKADMTRTIYLGNPLEQEKRLYEEMLEIQEELLELCLPGTNCSEIDKVSRNLLGKKGKLFIHSLGHGTGVRIHELPNISPGSKDVLQEGMSITVEPGIYDKKKGYGIRIEDSLIVKKGRPENMTKKAKKNLIVMPFRTR